MVDHVAVHGTAETAELADVGHFAGAMVLLHVRAKRGVRVVVLLADPTHQHVGRAQVNLNHMG